jgi:hypothetical protein
MLNEFYFIQGLRYLYLGTEQSRTPSYPVYLKIEIESMLDITAVMIKSMFFLTPCSAERPQCQLVSAAFLLGILFHPEDGDNMFH